MAKKRTPADTERQKEATKEVVRKLGEIVKNTTETVAEKLRRLGRG